MKSEWILICIGLVTNFGIVHGAEPEEGLYRDPGLSHLVEKCSVQGEGSLIDCFVSEGWMNRLNDGEAHYS